MRHEEKVSYDDNGNILSYLRHGNTAVGHLGMDSLTYHYNKNTNQLAQVTDVIPSIYYSVNIHNETSKHNYRYNGIGELASDSIAGIDSIYWTVYNKVHKIVKTNNDSIVFMYDPLGNRLEARNFPHSGISDTVKYTRDAIGNIMAIYDRKKDTVRLSEFDIYGIRRLGSLDTVLRLQKFITGHGTLDSSTISYLERQKQYELTNHLGNVLVTVNDGKAPIDTIHHTGDSGIADYYLPIVINAQDYYPFGMIEVGRQYNLSGDSTYKYLYNGKLHDDNIYGKDNSYDYGARFYDPRLGRFMSIDPLTMKYAPLSPYAYVNNSPICLVDAKGKDIVYSVTQDKQGNMTLNITVNAKLLDNTSNKKGSDEIAAIRSSIERQAIETFSTSYKNATGKEISVNFNLNLTVAKSEADIKKDDHVITLVDNVRAESLKSGTAGGLATLGGNQVLINTSTEREYKDVGIVGTHEIGHLLGLFDQYTVGSDGTITSDNPPNIMGASRGTSLTNDQKMQAFDEYIDAAQKANKVGTEGGAAAPETKTRNATLTNEGDSKTEQKEFQSSNAY